MPRLAGEHADLPAMVRIMSDEIAEKSGNVWFESFDSAAIFEGELQHRCQRHATLFQTFCGLGRRDFGLIELIWNFAFFTLHCGILRCGLEPHDSDIMDMRHDGGDGPAFAVGRFCPPRVRW